MKKLSSLVPALALSLISCTRNDPRLDLLELGNEIETIAKTVQEGCSKVLEDPNVKLEKYVEKFSINPGFKDENISAYSEINGSCFHSEISETSEINGIIYPPKAPFKSHILIFRSPEGTSYSVSEHLFSNNVYSKDPKGNEVIISFHNPFLYYIDLHCSVMVRRTDVEQGGRVLEDNQFIGGQKGRDFCTTARAHISATDLDFDFDLISTEFRQKYKSN